MFFIDTSALWPESSLTVVMKCHQHLYMGIDVITYGPSLNKNLIPDQSLRVQTRTTVWIYFHLGYHNHWPYTDFVLSLLNLTASCLILRHTTLLKLLPRPTICETLKWVVPWPATMFHGNQFSRFVQTAEVAIIECSW